MSPSKVILILIAVALVVAYYFYDLGQYLNFDYVKSQQQTFIDYTDANPIKARGGYFIFYVIVAALSLPGALVLTLLGGAVFGFWWALLLVSFASSIGATLAFLASRYLFRDVVSKRFSNVVSTINRGVASEGVYYLFGLRLVPVFPFFLINLVMGLTTMPTQVFYIVSQLGMLPGTMVYVNAGTQLGSIENPKDIFTLPVLASFILLAVLPFILKRGMDIVKKRTS